MTLKLAKRGVKGITYEEEEEEELENISRKYRHLRGENLISIGVRDSVGGQGQYWLFHYQKSDFRHFEYFYKMLFWLVGPKKLI